MTTRRKLLTSVILLSTGAAAGYLINDQLMPRYFATDGDGADRLPPSGLVGVEFENGKIEKIGDLLVSRSEFEWMNRYHPDVKDPYDITKLLAGY